MAPSAYPELPIPPTLTVNGSPAQDTNQSTTQYYTYCGDGIVPIQSTSDNLGKLLRTYCVTDGIDGKFWTNRLLQHILIRQRIRHELKKHHYKFTDKQVDEYVEKIHPSLESSSSAVYIKIFALLVLLDRVDDIEHFINEKVDDQVLPIELREEHVYQLSNPERRLRCFDKWKTSEQEHFELSQWMVDTPYLQTTNDDDQTLAEFTMPPDMCKPWREVKIAGAETLDGAYGTVIQVQIHPTAHSYQQLLEGINLDCATFAIKTLHKNTEQMFKKEWEMLKLFSGLHHPHLVTALSAFRQAGRLSFIFPYAPSDFERYKEASYPPQGRSGALWISAQLKGLIGAIDTMHNPKHLHDRLGPVKKYGRHNDIKCDNILCFRKSGTTDEVILVISDFGLSAFNSDKSRSNIPNESVPPVPGYRPPECDIEGGTISRAFDIWTVGCLFLELITWFLGGPKYVKEFGEKRTTLFINGSNNNIFFSFNNLLESGKLDGTKAILVKPEVTDWIYELHQHPKCSQFLHDALDIVEQEMLVVLSADKQRSSSGDLTKAFVRISGKCQSEEYTEGKPWTKDQAKAAQDQARQSTAAVRAVPNKNARALINMNQIVLPIHRGRTTLSLSKDEYKNMV